MPEITGYLSMFNHIGRISEVWLFKYRVLISVVKTLSLAWTSRSFLLEGIVRLFGVSRGEGTSDLTLAIRLGNNVACALLFSLLENFFVVQVLPMVVIIFCQWVVDFFGEGIFYSCIINISNIS